MVSAFHFEKPAPTPAASPAAPAACLSTDAPGMIVAGAPIAAGLVEIPDDAAPAEGNDSADGSSGIS